MRSASIWRTSTPFSPSASASRRAASTMLGAKSVRIARPPADPRGGREAGLAGARGQLENRLARVGAASASRSRSLTCRVASHLTVRSVPSPRPSPATSRRWRCGTPRSPRGCDGTGRAVRAMVLQSPRPPAPRRRSSPIPEPGAGEVLLEVAACGVCRTDLHVVDGELPDPQLPLVLGHQIVARGGRASGERFGCGRAGRRALARLDLRHLPLLPLGAREPLRPGAASPATSATAATHSGRSPTSASAFRCPPSYPDLQAAPLLCAGLIGYRTLRLAGDAERLGLYGFGAAAHIVSQVAAPPGPARLRLHAPGRRRRRSASRSSWAPNGPATATRSPPEELDAALIFAPAGELVPAALRARRQGRRGGLRRHPHERHPGVSLRAAVGRARRCARWRTSPAPTARSSWRWRRRCRCAPRSRLSRSSGANEALERLRAGSVRGAAVVVP